jgi:hypothetical protein
MSTKWWNENKMGLAPIASLILWAVSVLCFVFGLSFKNPIGYSLGGWDVSIIVAFALSLAITIIQLIGNGKNPKDMDTVFLMGWVASYALGIASNVNALLHILDMGNVGLEWVVSMSLGTMIEVMPEKLLIVWLRTLNDKKPQQHQNKTQNKHIQFPHPIQKSTYKAQHKPTHIDSQIPQFPWMNSLPKQEEEG